MLDTSQTERIMQLLETTEAELTRRVRVETAASGRTSLVPRVVFILIGILALANLYFVNQLTLEVRAIITHLNEMYGHFGTVAGRMSDIRADMGRIERVILLMPVLDEQMSALAREIEGMRVDMDAMTASLSEMDQRVGAMNQAVTDMALRFRTLNQKVGQMGLDVDQMARPVP